MLFEQSVFIGIDPTAGKRPLAYAAIDKDLRLLCLDSGDIQDVTAFAGGQEQALVAICGPQRPHQGLMGQEDLRASLRPVPRPGRWGGYRVAEYILNQHKIRMPRTRAQPELCPSWMQVSFDLYRRLANMGYEMYPGGEDASHLMIETYPYAAYAVLLGHLPLPKTGLEGRLQRQLVLYDLGVGVPDPMRIFEEITRYRLMQGKLPLEGLYHARALDALVAAYTAWKAAVKPKGITLVGDATEGQIVLPVEALKTVYR